MRNTIFVAALFACTIAAIPAGSTTGHPPGYGVETLEWTVPQENGEAPLKVRGTVQDVVAELSKRDPDAAAKIIARGQEAHHSSLEKRATPGHYTCQYEASMWEMHKAQEYLAGVSGKPTNGPGPGNCGRVSCSYGTGVFWCNDATVSKTLGSFDDIRDGLTLLYLACQDNADGVGPGGQVFMDDGSWNVIARGGQDC
ncbi:hypothetical protein N7504_005743 [Penicillium tannophilum]|nr:hypothetical protein N7504_005743 [Penicillium tannophilum]